MFLTLHLRDLMFRYRASYPCKKNSLLYTLCIRADSDWLEYNTDKNTFSSIGNLFLISVISITGKIPSHPMSLCYIIPFSNDFKLLIPKSIKPKKSAQKVINICYNFAR